MNKFLYPILIFFIFPDLWLKAQGIVSADTCKVPSVITPNDDGLNDEFRIPCLPDDNPDSELMVFNEWGDRVYFSRPYKNDWTGTYKSMPLPDGTYYYLLKLTASTPSKKGYITVFR